MQTESLPELSNDYPLTAEQIADYQRHGHLLLRGVSSPEETEAYRTVITHMTTEFAKN
jgi:hypothetical protein